MTQPRRDHLIQGQSATFHCVARCARRGWLFGTCPETAKNFDHRKQWVEERIVHLADVFAVSVLSYAVMSNHFHIVVSGV